MIKETTTTIKPGYKKTPIGMIPKEWEVKKLGDFLNKIVGGGTPSRSKEEYWYGNIPWATVKDFATFNPEKTQEYITEKGLENSSSNLIPAKTLITATRMGLGKVSVYDVDVAINQDLKALFPKDDLDRKYLYHWFIRNEKYIESLGNGSTVKGITLDDLKSLKFLEVPLKEQKSIADCLSTWDAGIEKLTQLLQAKKQQKKGLMQKLLTGTLRLRSASGEKFDGEWKEVRLGDIGKVINGLTYSPNDIRAKGTLVLRSSNIQKGALSFEDNVYVDTTDLKYNPVREKDILICVRNGSKSLIGKNTLITKDIKGEAFGAFMSVYRSDLNDYVFQFFGTDQYQRQIEQNLGATINSINNSELRKLKILLPPKKEQIAIAEVLQSADQEIELLEQKLAAFQQQKKGLMQVLLTGEKRLIN